MLPDRGPGSRSRRLGAAVAAAALLAVVTPAGALAQESGSALPSDTGNSSTDSVESAVGQLPAEIVVGGDGLGSEALRQTGSAVVPEVAQSVGEVAGSVAPLEAVGVSGGSAAASLAASGSLPGSTYVNPVGSVGSGTIGLGSIAIPEYVLPVLSLQFATGFFTALGERQEAGELYPHELNFWHGVVEGSAEGGALLQDAADATGTELPGGLAGSIDRVQVAALEDPFEENERRRAEAQAAAAEAEADAEDVTEAAEDETGADETGAAEDAAADGGAGEVLGAAPETMGDDDEASDSQAAGSPAGTAVEAAAREQTAPAESQQAAAPATLAVTGVETTTITLLAAASLLLGTLMLASTRRRA